jgi:peroxiredoxin Q/BCP
VALRDRADRFEALNTVVIGASFDTVEEQKTFADAQSFGFRLLADTDRTVGAAYGAARGPDEQYPDFPKRISYLIDPDGVIRRAYEVTDVDGHADAVLADLEELQAES